MSVIFDSAGATARARERNRTADARALASGHYCLWNARRRCFTVKSATTDATYDMSVLPSATGWLVLSCTCEAGEIGPSLPAGVVGCWHRARLARRLRRMGLASIVDGRWRLTARAIQTSEQVAA